MISDKCPYQSGDVTCHLASSDDSITINCATCEHYKERERSEFGGEMRISTERLEEIVTMGESSLRRDRPTYLQREDLAADLLEARKLLREIAEGFGDSKSAEAKKVRLRILAYILEEV